MPIAVGVSKRIVARRQSALGTVASAGDALAQNLRRVRSTIDLQKASYTSQEILPSMQRRDFRHGVRSVSGQISGELSVGGYQAFMESVLRGASVAGSTITTTAIITVAATTGTIGAINTVTFTRSALSYFTNGFRVGDIVIWSGWATTGTANNAKHMMIISLTATVMVCIPLDGTAGGAKVAGDSVTCVQVGRKIAIPATGQTRDYYTIEHAFVDLDLSEVFTDCVIGGMKVELPGTGMATVEFDVMGLNMVPYSGAGAPYFTSPLAASTGGILAAVNGVLIVAGQPVGIVTGVSININGNYSAPGGVVGSNFDPDIFQGTVEVTGQATVFFADATMRDFFLNENEVSMAVAMTASGIAAAPFTSFVMPRVKFGGATKDDGEKGLILTMPFTALENLSSAGDSLATTISIQDSAFA